MPRFLVLWELHGLEKSFLPIATLTGWLLFWICPTFSKEFLFSSFLAWRKLISENHNANSKEEGHLEKLRVQELLETVLTGIQKVLGKVDRFHFCPILKLWRLIWIEKSRNESIKSTQYIKIINSIKIMALVARNSNHWKNHATSANGRQVSLHYSADLESSILRWSWQVAQELSVSIINIMEHEVCFFCQSKAEQVCEHCHAVAFCGQDHALIHRPETFCFPFDVEHSPNVGRYMIATRDIKASGTCQHDLIKKRPYKSSFFCDFSTNLARD